MTFRKWKVCHCWSGVTNNTKLVPQHTVRGNYMPRIEDDILSPSKIKATRLFSSALFGRWNRRLLSNLKEATPLGFFVVVSSHKISCLCPSAPLHFNNLFQDGSWESHLVIGNPPCSSSCFLRLLILYLLVLSLSHLTLPFSISVFEMKRQECSVTEGMVLWQQYPSVTGTGGEGWLSAPLHWRNAWDGCFLIEKRIRRGGKRRKKKRGRGPFRTSH